MPPTSSLKFYLHHDPDALRMELSGSLSGADVESVFHAWHIEIDRNALRPFIADISFVTEADEYGLALLTLWHRSGAQIVARSEEARAIAEPILRQPIEKAVPKRGWFRRLFGFLLQDGPDGGAFTACAEVVIRASLHAGNRQAESTGPGDPGHVESGLR